jgi:glycosyltransferase involved in cell wall biosynthesis
MALLGDGFDGHVWIHGADLRAYAPETQERFRALLDATSETVTLGGRYDRARDLTRLMMATDWTVVPSIWWETGPLVVPESFQHGRPVICSDIGGMSEKVEHGVSGLHFNVGDPDDLAATLKLAVETPGLWERLHAGIPPVYEMGEHTEVVAGIYRQLLAQRGGGESRVQAEVVSA